MYDDQARSWVRNLRDQGMSKRAVSLVTGVSRAAIRDWESGPGRRARAHNCFRCLGESCSHPATYAYLLGQYLGDGYLVTRARIPKLRIACAQAHPGIASEVDEAMLLISGNRPGHVTGIGCDDHYSYWMHWPCVIPQHGPGRKHERLIALAGWQQQIVDEHPWSLIRGLIQSDGCRAINQGVVRGSVYRYPRYFFSNESRDIHAIMGAALDGVGVAWRFNNPNSISIAKRAAVALMDEHVGPKA